MPDILHGNSPFCPDSRGKSATSRFIAHQTQALYQIPVFFARKFLLYFRKMCVEILRIFLKVFVHDAQSAFSGSERAAPEDKNRE